MELQPQSIDHRILAALGQVVILSATVDGFVQEYVSKLLHANPTAMYVVNQSVAASTLSNWARILTTDYVTEPARTEALEILSLVDDLRADRNALVHGIWQVGPHPETAMVQTVRLDRVEILRNELVTYADLDHLTDDLRDAHTRFAALAEKLDFAQF